MLKKSSEVPVSRLFVLDEKWREGHARATASETRLMRNSTLFSFCATAILVVGLSPVPVSLAAGTAADSSASSTHRTLFRGLGLGQSRQEVEGILATLGAHCIASDEIKPMTSGGPFGEQINGLVNDHTCLILPNGVDFSQPAVTAVFYDYLMSSLMKPDFTFAVRFDVRGASELNLAAQFFNADGQTPEAFAQNILRSYSVSSGLTPTKNGWTGVTDNGEVLTVRYIPGTANVFLNVKTAGTFN
jgi:hypothetical protein